MLYLPVLTRGAATLNATFIARTPTSCTLQVEVPYNGSMPDLEEALRHRLNAAGVGATAEGLRQFDTDASPVTAGSVGPTTEGQAEKDSQAPYGAATVARHVYQGPRGGPTYCPLGRGARIAVSSTPRLAEAPSHKYAGSSSPRARIDPEEGHGRAVSRCLIQDVADAAAAAAPAEQEGRSSTRPRSDEPPGAVATSPDGACTLMGEGGWREATAGAPAFYGRGGERPHTAYPAAAPESGKAKLLGHLGAGIGRAEAEGPVARHVGVADGAGGSRESLGRHTDVQGAGLWHAAEYPGEAAVVLYRGHPRAEEAWLGGACHRRKHEPGGAERVLNQSRRPARARPWAKGDEAVQRAATYIANRSGTGRMGYASRVAVNEPIGGGVTEAACQVIVKQRPCGSGMRWAEGGAAVVPSLRALSDTPGRWSQFWSKVDRRGFPVAA